MARSYTHITTAIWRDPEFRALPVEDQWTYLMLVTQPDVTSCGMLSIAMRRWAQNSQNMSTRRIGKSINSLSDSLFVIPDYDTEELLIRTFVKWDGGYSNPKRLPAITAACALISSDTIRRALAIELDKLEMKHSLWDSLSDRHRDSPRVVVTKVGTSTNPQPATHTPQPATHNPQPFGRNVVVVRPVSNARDAASNVDAEARHG